ncbi:3-dehydroquinate synthase [Woodsholea maritima]|uniref:3-dehydroquinate synthase n=1 Tax=Woodsholea maritima TaxID=240237 RepID=UPI00037C6163|nr:3-dehydroquinate synthase [Woodsholea maritima]
MMADVSTLRRVHIDLGPESYDVVIGEGALEGAGPSLAQLCPRGRAIIVADPAALAHHRARLEQVLAQHGLTPLYLEIPGGEQAKSFHRLEALCAELLDANVERQECVIAFGGGTIGDLTGFAAAIVKRGVKFVQIPTTLLAQVDSSVGGKTGINTARGKNLIGAFHQPSLVIADLTLLASLPARELRAGYAEIIKAALIGDRALFTRLDTLGLEALNGEGLAEAVEAAVAFKGDIVRQDEKEAGVRALLNLGHTFGHAFEAEAEKGTLIHGEAVALGLALAFRYSARLSLCAQSDARAVEAHLAKVGLPAFIAELPGGPYEAEGLLNRMKDDKKNKGGVITLILARAIGDAFITSECASEDVLAFLHDELKPQ